MAKKRKKAGGGAEVEVLRKAAAQGSAVSITPWPLLAAAILYVLLVDDVRLKAEPEASPRTLQWTSVGWRWG